MKNILKRDITGKCVGECRDIVREAEEKRQAEIDRLAVESPESYPSMPNAFSRNEPPGVWGGHV